MNRGVLLGMCATLSFVVMVGLVRGSAGVASPMELVFWRSVVGIGVMGTVLRGRPGPVSRPGLLSARILLGFAAMSCFFVAASRISLTEISLVSRLQPVLVAMLAPLLLGRSERVEPRIVAALLVGLTGCVVLIGPAAMSGSPWGMLVLCAAAFSATAHVSLRALGATEDPSTIVAWFQLGAAVLAWSAESLWRGSPLGLPDPSAWPWILGIGAAATAGQLLLTFAYKQERAAPVAAASYTGPLWAVVGDLVFFGFVPTWNMWVGGPMVVGAGLWLLTSRDRGALAR